VRLFAARGMELLIGQSYSKNLGQQSMLFARHEQMQQQGAMNKISYALFIFWFMVN